MNKLLKLILINNLFSIVYFISYLFIMVLFALIFDFFSGTNSGLYFGDIYLVLLIIFLSLLLTILYYNYNIYKKLPKNYLKNKLNVLFYFIFSNLIILFLALIFLFV